MTTTWNASDKSAAITLSGGNLIATGTSFNFNGMRSNTSKNLATETGKYYFEVTCNASFSDSRSAIGFATGAASLGSTPASAHIGGVTKPGTVVEAAGFDPITTTLGAFTSKTVGVAMDFANLRYWITEDGSTWNAGGTANPATGVGFGLWQVASFPTTSGMFIYGTIIDNGAAMTLNAGASAFVFTKPTGFSAWDAPAAVPTFPFATMVC
jgi:hypothetical protein